MKAPAETLDGYSSGYKLPRDETETLRLTTQHYIFIRRQGWLIHPKIQKAISNIKNPQIADVACGTGIWGFEAATEYPNSTVTGIDISDVQYPPQWTWPSNATLETLDFSKPVPKEHQAKYDVVHCRLLLQAGPNVDPRIWVKGFESLLKPGGWLQWEEPSLPSFTRLSCAGQKKEPIAFSAITKAMGLAMKAGWFPDFENWMRQNSTLEDLEKINVPVDLSVAKIDHDVNRHTCWEGNVFFQKIADLDDEFRAQLQYECVDQFVEAQMAGDLVVYDWNVGLAKASGDLSEGSVATT